MACSAFVKQLCSDALVVCLQEHWLRFDQLAQFSNIFSDFDAYAHSVISIMM